MVARSRACGTLPSNSDAMAKYHGPKPAVEHHYHIQELIDRQEKRTEDRVAFQNKEKAKEERDKMIKDAKVRNLLDFWCDRCQKDLKGEAILQVEQDWSKPEQCIAFYKTVCFKGHWLIRHVTDRHLDPYWTRSKAVQIDRGKHHNDLIQPWESGFELLYGRKNKS